MRLTSLMRLRQKPFAPGCTYAPIMTCARDNQVRELCAGAIIGLMVCIFQAAKPALLPIIGMWTSNLAGFLFISLTVTVIRVSVKKTQDRLRVEVSSNETRYRLRFSKSLTGAYRSTVDGRILDCNVAFCKAFGHVAREEVISQSGIIGHFSQADRAAFTDRLHAEKDLPNLEQRLRGKDGDAVWVLDSAALVPMRSERAWSAKAA